MEEFHQRFVDEQRDNHRSGKNSNKTESMKKYLNEILRKKYENEEFNSMNVRETSEQSNRTLNFEIDSTDSFDDRSTVEFNFDPDPIVEEKMSEDKIYSQRVYLRQLQPPTPQPIEIQVREVLIGENSPINPLHVHLRREQPRTPSPIIIRGQMPKQNQTETKPIVYNKYLPKKISNQRQIIIHKYPEMPPKPRPIIVEQWLPFKEPTKKLIYHRLDQNEDDSSRKVHNLIVSYSKPRAFIEVELIHLPIVKVDQKTYQQMRSTEEQK